MSTRRITLTDGTRLTTGSACRYVTFLVDPDGSSAIVKRTDSPATALVNHGKASRTARRVVTVDFVAGLVAYDKPARVLDDLDRRMAEMNAAIRAGRS